MKQFLLRIFVLVLIIVLITTPILIYLKTPEYLSMIFNFLLGFNMNRICDSLGVLKVEKNA